MKGHKINEEGVNKKATYNKMFNYGEVIMIVLVVVSLMILILILSYEVMQMIVTWDSIMLGYIIGAVVGWTVSHYLYKESLREAKDGS